MTPEQIAVVQDSFQRVMLIKGGLAKTFYEELFRIAPSLRPFFPEDMNDQRVKLLETLSYTVNHLTALDLLKNTIVGLARRHVGYGAKAEHFPPVGVALIYALEIHLSGGMTKAETEAWLAAFALITNLMVAEMRAQAA